MNCHIGVGSHDLLFGRQLGALLELKVTDGTGQSEVAVHTAKVDEATRGTDTGLLACKMELASHPHRMNLADFLLSCWLQREQKSLRMAGHRPSFCGLWSKERGFARPLTPNTDRESPAFAYSYVSFARGLRSSILCLQFSTYHPDLVLGDDSCRGRATGHFLFVFRVCRATLGSGGCFSPLDVALLCVFLQGETGFFSPDGPRTFQNCPISSQEAILQGLLNVSLGE